MMRKLKLTHYQIGDALDVERVRFAADGYGAPLPLGSKVAFWRRLSYGRGIWARIPSGTGTIEVVTSENRSTFAGNQNVSLGQFVVRVSGGKKWHLRRRYANTKGDARRHRPMRSPSSILPQCRK